MNYEFKICYFFLYFIFIIMPKFSNGKVTSSVIIYNRGVPNSNNSFGRLAAVNYTMLRQVARNNITNKRPIFSFM